MKQKQLNKEKRPKYLDKTLSLEERKQSYKEEIEKMMNPFLEFDPDHFEPIINEVDNEVLDRVRIVPPKELPTFDLKPKEIREGQMIGLYESKQDLYLVFAHRCNEMQEEIDLLKEEIKKIKKAIE